MMGDGPVWTAVRFSRCFGVNGSYGDARGKKESTLTPRFFCPG